MKDAGKYEEGIMTRSDRTKCLPDTEASECYDSQDIYSFNLNRRFSFLKYPYLGIYLKLRNNK